VAVAVLSAEAGHLVFWDQMWLLILMIRI